MNESFWEATIENANFHNRDECQSLFRIWVLIGRDIDGRYEKALISFDPKLSKL